jgi:hypothetical protein
MIALNMSLSGLFFTVLFSRLTAKYTLFPDPPPQTPVPAGFSWRTPNGESPSLSPTARP